MIAATPVHEELTVDTGHAPFAASPLELAGAIEKALQWQAASQEPPIGYFPPALWTLRPGQVHI
jgi:hypothetical protein